MHRDVSINTLCLAPAPLAEHIEAIARLGAQAMSPVVDQVRELGVQQTDRQLREAGLEVATLSHMAFGFASPDETEAARARLDQTIEIAAGISAKTITMTTGGRGRLTWTEAAERFAEAVAPCGERAKAAGIKLGIEGTSHLYSDSSIAHRLSDTVRLAQMGSICPAVDVFACWFDSDIDQAISDAGPDISVIQVSDYVYGDRGLPCRAVPGDGAIPLHQIIPALVSSGFTGHYDLEIIGPRLEAEGREAGLRRAANYIGALLEKAGRPSG